MRRRVSLVVAGLAGGLILVSVLLMANSPGARTARARAEKIAAAGEEPAARPPALQVEAVRVRPSPAPVLVEIAATLEGVHSVVIGSEASGRVVEVTAGEHEPVEAGSVLVRLDDELAAAAVERARAALMRAGANLALARSQFGRQRNLSGKGVASAAEYDRSASEEQASEASVAEARAALHEAEAQLEKTQIRAPFAGVVGRIELEPGAYVRAGDPVTELVDLSAVEVEIEVDDRQILALRPGHPVTLRVDAYPGERFEGRIRALARAPDRDSRKYPAPAVFPNPEGRLLPGMLGSVRLQVGEERPVLRVPRSAARREFELDYLFVLDARGRREGVAVARKRRAVVRPVPFRPDLLDVSAGLEPGDVVAVSGVRELRDGLPVRYAIEADAVAAR